MVERLAEIFNIPPKERTAFLHFGRGDWRAAPTGGTESAPWLEGSPGSSHPKTHLATFLFTDIEGSAKLWEEAPGKMKVALQRHHAILQEAIASKSGDVFQIVGDAFCAAFPTVLFAISAAVQAQRELYREQWDLPFPIRVRIGIHTGEAEQTMTGGYASNPTLNRAARILTAAHGGQILLSLATKDLVKDSLPANTELRDMGEHYLKNLMYPEHLFQLNIAGLPSDFPPLNTLTHRQNLPVQVTSFIAREAEIALVHEYLSNDDIRLVTLIGPPGIGKTRLSIEAGRAVLHEFPDGVFFVALAPLEDPTRIASTIAQGLGYVEARDLPTTEQLKEGMGDKHLLLVLDNCEHLIDDVASLAADLLSACPHLKILATSRESLRIPGEWLYAVPAFDLPAESFSLDVEDASNYPALILFAERARAVRSDFSLNADNIKTIAEICARLDGLPLVIELIAARMRLMTPQALLDRLSGQFVLTADGMRAASERQKTLHNAIDWSYNLLPPEEQKLFAYLSVFSGGFTLEAVEAMFSQEFIEKPLPHLFALLLDKSLVKLAPAVEASHETRYTMLVTIQEYAQERLREIGEEKEIRNLHLAYFLDLAERGDAEIRGPNLLKWLQRLGIVRDNFRAALEWAIGTGQIEAALQIARKLHWFFFVHGDHNEGRQWLGRVLALPNAALYPEAYAEVLTQLAHHTWLQIGPKEAKPFVVQALKVARANDDKHNTAKALAILGLVLTHEHNYEAAQARLEESQRLFREVDDPWGYAHAVLSLAQVPLLQDDHAAALALHEQAHELFRKVGDPFFQSAAIRLVGYVRLKQANWSLGEAALREALTLAQQFGGKDEIARGLWTLAFAAKGTRNPARAVRLFWVARTLFDSIGAWQQVDDPEFEDGLATCRAALSESEFAEVEAQGRAMTMEQAISYALESKDA
jgi:predicted ATPase/class 3 adenylate cyclase